MTQQQPQIADPYLYSELQKKMVAADDYGNYDASLSPRQGYANAGTVVLDSTTQMLATQVSRVKINKSPTKRPESPPPLKNLHQTVVFIPFNNNPYRNYTFDKTTNQMFAKSNLLEIEKVGP